MHAARCLDKAKHRVSAHKQVGLLSVLLGEAVRWGWIENNPLRHIRKQKEEERRWYLADD